MKFGIDNQPPVQIFFALFWCSVLLTSVLSAQEGYSCPKRRKISEFGKNLGLQGLNTPNRTWYELNRPAGLTETEEKSDGCIYAFLRGYNQGLKESGLDKLMQYFLYEKKEQEAKDHGYIHLADDVLQKL